MPDSSVNPVENTTSGGTALQRALSLVGKGYFVFPARVVRKPDGTKDVRPYPNWDESSSSSAADVHEWFGPGAEWEHATVCIDCGRSGIVVVDLDEREGDPESGLANWLAVEGNDTRPFKVGGPWTVETPGGGRHLFYRNDPNELIGSRNGAWPHVDVKGVGGLVFAYGFVPKASELPRRPDILAAKVKVVGKTVARVSPERGSPFDLPSDGPREFTQAEAVAFCSPYMVALGSAPRGQINERLNTASVAMSHFVPEFWNERDVTGWLLEQQRVAWVAAGGADDGNYDAASATIRSGLGAVGWRARRRAEPAGPSWTGGAEEVPTGDALDDELSRLWGEFLDVGGLAKIPPPVPLIRGLLFRQTLVSLTGPYGSLKTFVGIDMALCVAAGVTWHMRDVRQGPVWYLLAEGVPGLRKRVEAWQEVHPGADVSGFRVLPFAVQVKTARWDVLVELARRERPALIVVDTRARHSVGLEENQASDMSILVERFDALREAAGATVAVVTHTGWDNTRMRGSSAWGGAVDTDLLIEKSGPDSAPIARITVQKQKDSEPIPPVELHATVHELGVDADGQVVTSLAFMDEAFDVAPAAEQQIAGALDVREEQMPEALVDLVAVLESIAPAGSRFGRSQAEVRGLMTLGGPIHPAVRRVCRRGKYAGQKGYSRSELHQAFVLAAAYGWLETAETPSKYTIRSESDRADELAHWRERNADKRD